MLLTFFFFFYHRQRNLKTPIIPAGAQSRVQQPKHQTASTSRKRGQEAVIKTALSSEDEVYQDSPNSYQDDLIDYSANVDESNVTIEVSSIPSPQDGMGGVMLVQG